MNSLIKSKPKPNVLFSRAWKLTGAFLIVVYLFYSFLPTTFFRITEPVVKPLWSLREWSLGITKLLPNFLSSKQVLIAENNALKLKTVELELRIQNTIIGSSQENVVLQGSASTSQGIRHMTARIISRPSQSPYDILILDIGDQSVQVGQKVTGPGGVALGEIIQVYRNTAKARLYSSPDIETETQQVSTGAVVILKGKGGGNFSVSVPKGFSISVGDYFMIPGLQNKIVAQVGSIEEGEANSFKEVTLSFPISIFSISYVDIHE